jgi:hypothetical protein
VCQSDRRNQISIRSFNVPDRLKGALVSVEIIPEHGKARRTMFTVSDAASLQDVEGPGTYLVRATLPSGQLIAHHAVIPDESNAEGIAIGEAALDFGDLAASTNLGLNETVSTGRPFLKSALSAVGLAIRGLLRRGDGEDSRFSLFNHQEWDNAESIGGEYEWGTFDRWSTDASTIIVRRGGVGGIDLNGHMEAPLIKQNLRQMLIKAAPPGEQIQVLVSWVLDTSRNVATIAVDPAGAKYRSGAYCVVSREHAEPITTSLFSYLRAGALEQARSGVSALTAMLDRPEGQDELGSDEATMAAYVLHRLRAPNSLQTIDNLACKYADLVDLRVLQGVQRISEGRAENAAEYLNAALKRGVPGYTEGVRLLRDGLNFLTDLYPMDTIIRTNARRANSLASAANFDSEMTCLRLGPDIVVEFV